MNEAAWKQLWSQAHADVLQNKSSLFWHFINNSHVNIHYN